MKRALWFGIFMILLGITLGLYLGIWVMFIGGIVQAVNALKAQPIESLYLAIGIVRIFLAVGVGWASALLCIIPGCLAIATYFHPHRL